MKILVAASGELGFTTITDLFSDLQIKGILTDSGSTKIINWAKENNIPVIVGNPRSKSYFSMVEAMGEIDILLSINYLYIINLDLIQYPKIIALNIHGSKLPKYRGRAPHIWAIINGENEIGITLHRIDEGCDTGEILIQRIIPLTTVITGGEVLEIFSKQYPEIIREACRIIAQGKIVLKEQDHTQATYFEKRTPDDGEIDWRWDRKRIYNWVRALTAPYPGAFTFYEGKKVKIWNVRIGPKMKGQAGHIVRSDENYLSVHAGDGIILVENYTIDTNLQIKINSQFQEGKNAKQQN